MVIPFAINGLGRIGRALARIAAHHPQLRLVAVNDRADAATLARLLAYDSVHGRFAGVSVKAASPAQIQLGDNRVQVFAEKPGRIPWGRTGARIVVEATGDATRRALAARHLGDGVAKVVVSAPLADADAMLCLGVNVETYAPSTHHVISNSSCTTNCLALLLHVLHGRCGVAQALMNEVHSYTVKQRLVDGVHAEPRRGRAAAVNIVPTTTGAPAAVERLLPALAGRVAGHATRVPTPNVALLDLVAVLDTPTDAPTLNETFRRAAQGEALDPYLAVSEEPLVSTDYIGDSHSAVVDLALTQVTGGTLARVMAWYDNEWGYAQRLADLLVHIGGSLK